MLDSSDARHGDGEMTHDLRTLATFLAWDVDSLTSKDWQILKAVNGLLSSYDGPDLCGGLDVFARRQNRTYGIKVDNRHVKFNARELSAIIGIAQTVYTAY